MRYLKTNGVYKRVCVPKGRHLVSVHLSKHQMEHTHTSPFQSNSMHRYTVITLHETLAGIHKWKLWDLNKQRLPPVPHLSIYSLLCPPRCTSFWSLSALLQLHSARYIVPDKHFSSPDKSFVWGHLFCEIVLVTCKHARWWNMISEILAHTHLDIRG